MKSRIIYPLLENAFNKSDIKEAQKVINSQRLTMSGLPQDLKKSLLSILGLNML